MTRPYATTTVNFTMNLDARVSDLSSANFDPSDSNTYHYSDNITVYDSLGVTHTLESFFVKTNINEWSVYVTVNGLPTYNTHGVPIPNGTMQYPVTGTGISPTFTPSIGITVTFTPLDTNGNPTGAVSPVGITMDLTEATQFGSDFTSSLEQDGGFNVDLVLAGTEGSDYLIGGRGDDKAIFDYPTKDVIKIDYDHVTGVAKIIGPHGIDTLRSIEKVQFTDYTVPDIERLILVNSDDETITVTDGYYNYIIPGASTQKISSGQGDDFIIGVSAGETIDGGSGYDTVHFGFASNEVTKVARKLDGSVELTSSEGTKILSNIEYLVFQSESFVSVSDFVALKNVDKPVFSLADGNGGNIEATPEVYSGPVDFLQYQLLGDTSGNVMTGSEFNDFLNLQDGDDAANGGDGQDVLDGGTGSNFLTGGAGNDTFYLDGRSGSTTWSTVTDFDSSVGDAVNIWGWIDGTSRIFSIDASNGAEGFEGVTLHFDMDNNGTVETSLTFTGLGQFDLPNSSAQMIEDNGYLLFA